MKKRVPISQIMTKNVVTLTTMDDLVTAEETFKKNRIRHIPIVSGATAYDHHDGHTYILVLHESLYYGTQLDHSLINPNQVRHYGIDLWDNLYDKERGLNIQTD